MLNTLIKCYVSFPLYSSPWIPKHCSNYYVLLSFLSKLCHTSKTYQNLQETLITQILSSYLSFSLTPLIIFLKHLTFHHFSLYLATLTNHLNTTKTTSFLSIWQVNVPPNLTNSETYHQTTNILLHNQIPF